jgi:hypothetical protein
MDLSHSAFAQLANDLVRTDSLSYFHVELRLGLGETSPKLARNSASEGGPPTPSSDWIS